jgi:ABC-type molybdate transport system substrate-binding protein
MAAGSFLSVTCLPNGFDPDTQLPQLSLSLLPTIDSIALGDSIFKDWPAHLSEVRASLNKAKLLFGTAGNLLCPITLSTDSSQDQQSLRMWNALFDYQLSTKTAARAASVVAKTHATTWMLSHDAASLQQAHLAHRIERLAAEMTNDPAAMQTANAKQQLINVYLNPNLKPLAADETRLSFSTLLGARTDALTYCQQLAKGALPTGFAYTSKNFSSLVTARFNHALKILQQGDERLMDIGVYAACLSCASSLLRHADPTDTGVPKDAATAVTLLRSGAGTPDPVKYPHAVTVTSDALEQAVRYVEFLLYSRRSRILMGATHKKPMDCPPVPPPDFHQTIDLLRRFPAILRPLGLVFDVAVQLPANAIPDGNYRISIDQLTVTNLTSPALCLWTSTDLKRPVNSAKGIFCPANFPSGAGATPTLPGNNLTSNRYLNLGALNGDPAVGAGNLPVYSLVTEDAENETHKRVQSAKAVSQAGQYHSSANQTKPSNVSSLDDLPSTRTGGISLLHTQRTERLTRAAQRVSDPRLGGPDMPFFADDLIMGYRFDVRLSGGNDRTGKVVPPGRWYGLGARKSDYIFVDENLKKIGLRWAPSGKLELAADEGYVSAAATMTMPDAKDGEHQLQAHQAMFTWSGPGIGYTPKSGTKEAINDDGEAAPQCDQSVHLRMTPVYTRGERLLQLRFQHRYDLRCRIVDLAGNSAPRDETGFDSIGTAGKATVLSAMMQRHEPIRSPQVLLTEKLDRQREPGAQSDRLVVRTENDETTRAIVPPREGLRFAYMHGVVKDKSTQGAFSNIELNDDGSFPSVEDDPTSVEGKDAIFRYSSDGSDPAAPFFPDPVVDQLRVNLGSVSLPAGVSTDALKQAISHTFSFYPRGGAWPRCLPCRIRVSGGKQLELKAEVKDVLLDDNGPNTLFVSGLVITLPPAAVITLNVSSSGADVDATGKSLDGASIKTAATLQSGAAHLLALQPPAGTMGAAGKGGSVQPQAGSGVTLVRNTRSKDGKASAALPTLDPNNLGLALVSGHYKCTTPPQAITLVHAVEQPLIQVEPQGGKFEFRRDPGATAALLRSDLPGDAEVWVSAAKISCTANWTDCVDDITKDDLTHVSVAEQVFEIAADDWNKNANVFHHLRDTRAHDIVYLLSATSAFRDYFPADDPPDKFVLSSPALPSRAVCSSVRPPAPVLSYCLPSFAVREDDNSTCKGWVRQRLPAIRCYFERPFLVSGNKEKIAAVLLADGQADDGSAATAYVSRIGQDPLWLTDASRTMASALSATALTNCAVATKLQLAENNAIVDIAVFKTEYSRERKLWHCDIPFNLVGQYTPFVRLALVRYQEDALHSIKDNVEARISSVVLADFAQIAPNRYAALQRTGRAVTLTVSGDAYAMRAGGVLQDPTLAGMDKARPTPVPFDNTFTVELQHRWHRLPLDFDPGWRPTSFKVPPPKTEVRDGIVTWKIQFQLPESPAVFKYRMLLRECETLYADSDAARKANTQSWTADLLKNGSVKSVQRMVYMDFFEL